MQVPKDFDLFSAYVSLPQVRKSIHVGNLTFNSGEKVEKFLLKDMLQSVKPWLAETMDNYKVWSQTEDWQHADMKHTVMALQER